VKDLPPASPRLIKNSYKIVDYLKIGKIFTSPSGNSRKVQQNLTLGA
jgi:hypothetical protein